MAKDHAADTGDDFHLHYLRARCHPKAGLVVGMSHDGHMVISCKRCQKHVASYDVKNPPELKCELCPPKATVH